MSYCFTVFHFVIYTKIYFFNSFQYQCDPDQEKQKKSLKQTQPKSLAVGSWPERFWLGQIRLHTIVVYWCFFFHINKNNIV